MIVCDSNELLLMFGDEILIFLRSYMMKRVNLLLVLLALVSVANAGMFYDAGSDASGYPDTPGSIVDASGTTEFYYYDGANDATESIDADSFTVTQPITSDWTASNAYSAVYFDGAQTPSGSHPMADLGFDIHDPSVAYSVTTRVKIDSALIGNVARSAFTLYFREGTGTDSGQGFKQGIASIQLKADSQGMADNATNPLKLYNLSHDSGAVFTMGDWHDITIEYAATTTTARGRKVFLDGVEVLDITWDSYWNYNGADAMMNIGVSNPDVGTTYSIDSVEIVSYSYVDENTTNVTWRIYDDTDVDLSLDVSTPIADIYELTLILTPETRAEKKTVLKVTDYIDTSIFTDQHHYH
jgi:hypothetical protein